MQSAFDALDVKSGHHNQVRLYDLRKALKGVSREAFDAAIQPLRRHVSTLSAEEGRFGRLPPEVVEAGIPGPSGAWSTWRGGCLTRKNRAQRPLDPAEPRSPISPRASRRTPQSRPRPASAISPHA